MPQGVEADQGLLDRSRIKGMRIKHPLRNQPFLASLGDDTEMAFPFTMLFAQDHSGLSI